MWKNGDGVVGERLSYRLYAKVFSQIFVDNSFYGNLSQNQKTLFQTMKRNEIKTFEPIIQKYILNQQLEKVDNQQAVHVGIQR